MLLLQWSRIFVLDYPGAYRTVTLLVSTHTHSCVEKLPVYHTLLYCTLQGRHMWVKLGILRCGLFQMCCAMLRIIKWRIRLRVRSTLGRAVHFRVNTDAGDWEHPSPVCGSVGKQSLREQNEWQPESLCRYYRVHNAEKITIKSPVSRSLCCAWVKLPRIIFSRGFFRSVMYIYIIYDVVLLAI